MNRTRRLAAWTAVALGLALYVGGTRAKGALRPTGSPLVWVQMVSPHDGWALDAEGHVLRTEGDGARWHVVSAPTMATALRPVTSAVLRDGSWGGEGSVAFAFATPTSASVAVLGRSSGVRVFTTVDGGRTWHESTVEAPTGTSGIALSFADPEHGWLIGWSGDMAGSSRITLWATSTGGRSWSKVGSGWTGSVSGIRFADATSGWLTGSTVVYNRVLLLRSTDGGVHWQSETLPLPRGEFTVSTFPPLLVPGGAPVVPIVLTPVRDATTAEVALYEPTAEGAAWRRLALISVHGDNALGLDVSGPIVAFVGPRDGWLLVGRTFYLTTDGGATWHARTAPAGSPVALQFVSPEDGYLLVLRSGGSVLLRTTDGGRSWQPVRTEVR